MSSLEAGSIEQLPSSTPQPHPDSTHTSLYTSPLASPNAIQNLRYIFLLFMGNGVGKDTYI